MDKLLPIIAGIVGAESGLGAVAAGGGALGVIGSKIGDYIRRGRKRKRPNEPLKPPIKLPRPNPTGDKPNRDPDAPVIPYNPVDRPPAQPTGGDTTYGVGGGGGSNYGSLFERSGRQAGVSVLPGSSQSYNQFISFKCGGCGRGRGLTARAVRNIARRGDRKVKQSEAARFERRFRRRFVMSLSGRRRRRR